MAENQMELRDFVERTLVEIIEGVHAARRTLKDTDAGKDGAIVSPRLTGGTQNPIHTQDGGGYAHHVEFDVGVTVVEGEHYQAGGGAKLAVFSLKASGQAATQTTAVNRIKFSIPVQLPQTALRPTHFRQPELKGIA